MSIKAKDNEEQKPAVGNVVFLDTYTEIPTSTIKLNEAGQKTYDKWCKSLINSGLLNMKTQEHVETYAISVDELVRANRNGKSTRYAMEMRRSAMLKLEKLDANTTFNGPSGDNPYDHFGFAERARLKYLEGKP